MFKLKTKWRLDLGRDQSGFVDLANYQSAKSAAARIKEKFQADQARGRMQVMSLKAAKGKWGKDPSIASLAEIQEAEDKWRTLYDGTHGVETNNFIHMQDQLSLPK